MGNFDKNDDIIDKGLKSLSPQFNECDFEKIGKLLFRAEMLSETDYRLHIIDTQARKERVYNLDHNNLRQSLNDIMYQKITAYITKLEDIRSRYAKK